MEEAAIIEQLTLFGLSRQEARNIPVSSEK